VAKELKDAIKRGVEVKLIIDGKKNAQNFPREDNIMMLAAVKIPKKHYTLRQAKPNNIQHNKFMVLVKGGKIPTEVWTGSTNISLGGFSGQTNVGHWVRDAGVAKNFRIRSRIADYSAMHKIKSCEGVTKNRTGSGSDRVHAQALIFGCLWTTM